jgi:hypothetical protein
MGIRLEIQGEADRLHPLRIYEPIGLPFRHAVCHLIKLNAVFAEGLFKYSLQNFEAGYEVFNLPTGNTRAGRRISDPAVISSSSRQRLQDKCAGPWNLKLAHADSHQLVPCSEVDVKETDETHASCS